MSSPAPAFPHRGPTKGWFQCPTSIVENQAALTRAELALALITIRRGDKPLSDKTWKEWTGLKPRLKKYAIAGLKKKGLRCNGRGKQMSLEFDRDGWLNFVSHRTTQPREKMPRPKAVPAKRGAKVHPECRSRGCAMMRDADNASENVQNPAQSPCEPSENKARLTVLHTIEKVQNFAQESKDQIEQTFMKTMQAVQAIFPLVRVLFLVRLIAAVRALFPDVTDAEVAEGVRMCWEQHRNYQKREGLFILTVPGAVALIRKRPKDAARSVGPPGVLEASAAFFGRVADCLKARGAPFEGLRAEVESLAGQVAGATIDLPEAEKLLEGLERRVIDEGRKLIAPGVLEQLWQGVERDLQAQIKPRKISGREDKPYSDTAVESMRQQMRDQATLEHLEIPRLTLASL